MDAIEAGDRSSTTTQQGCRFCGYREVGWCEGVRVTRARAEAEWQTEVPFSTSV